MNAKPHILLLPLAVLCMAAVAWAANAPKAAPAPQPTATHVAPVASGDDKYVTVEVGDIDDDGLDLDEVGLVDDGEDGGADGDRHVIVRRIVRGGKGHGGGEGWGPMSGGMGRNMGHGMGMGMGRGPGMLAHMAGALDLSDAQREKMAAIHERQQRRDIQARADMQLARLDLRKAMSAEKPDGAAINAQIDHVAKLRTDMAKARVASHLEIRALLTPEQQKKMREMHMKGPGAGMPGMDRGPGMGPRGMGGPGMKHGGMPMRVRVERDTLIRN